MDLAQLFYKELQKIIVRFEDDPDKALKSLYQLFLAYLHEITGEEKIAFTTIFARIRFAAEKYLLPYSMYQSFQWYRKSGNPSFPLPDRDPDVLLVLGAYLIYASARRVYASGPDAFLEDFFDHHPPPQPVATYSEGGDQARRVLLTEMDEGNARLRGFLDNSTGQAVFVRYNVPGKNDWFNPTIQLLGKQLAFPVQVVLHGVSWEDHETLVPEAMVLEPDFLVDATAIAGCFRSNGVALQGYLLKKFLPYELTQPIMLGNIANYFLDELIRSPEKSFAALLPGIFRLFPLELALLSDKEVKELLSRSEVHYQHLRKVIQVDFPQMQVQPEACIIEPSFFSSNHGIQGRLDILYLDPLDPTRRVILELKSGKPYQATVWGINQDHLIQTLLYDLLIQAAFGKDQQAENYILYSGQATQQLYRAPRITAQQYDSLQVRNQMIALDFALARLGTDPNTDLLDTGDRFFGRWQIANFPQLSNFERKDILDFEKKYLAMSPLVRKYFIAFAGFIAREQILAKKGIEGIDQARGQAALWLNFPADKEAAFMIFQGLRWRADLGDPDPQVAYFDRSEYTGKLANFRTGDIALLYPSGEPDARLEASQVFKCTIIAVQTDQVVVRLRFPQADLSKYAYWNLEPDTIDTGFLSLNRGLFEFAGAPTDYQQLILGTLAPRTGAPVDAAWIREGLPALQRNTLEKALAAQDYFLLWGPPGTGKTSVFLRELTAVLMQHTTENVLVMAYTNRAVDEICEAIESAGITDFLRIGSEYACDPRFKGHLFSRQLEGISNRSALLELFKSKRLFVSTLAAISNNVDLFKIKQFDTAIIDEASQILEPMLAGVLSRFRRFFLIGDHHQLPSVVMQSESESAVADRTLQEIGLTNLRNSMFERLYSQARSANWTHAYAMLRHQGRMHADLMDFPGRVFYESNLEVLPDAQDPLLRQRRASWIDPDLLFADGQPPILFCRRRLYVPTRAESQEGGLKANLSEAQGVAALIAAYLELIPDNRLPSIGVITPYRAQIALIRQVLAEQDIDPDRFTIDTVERYQGGARDVIILSLCTNNLFQFRQVAQVSSDGVDRKLNVALTRAREQLIMLGNPDILRQMPFYGDWVASAEKLELAQGI